MIGNKYVSQCAQFASLAEASRQHAAAALRYDDIEQDGNWRKTEVAYDDARELAWKAYRAYESCKGAERDGTRRVSTYAAKDLANKAVSAAAQAWMQATGSSFWSGPAYAEHDIEAARKAAETGAVNPPETYS